MLRVKLAGVVIGTLLVGLTLGGCCDAEKKQITSLQGEMSKLQEQNKGLRDQITAANARESELANSRDSELAQKDRDIESLKKQLGEKLNTQASAPAPGWQVGALGDKQTIGTDVLFDSGKATLTAGGKTRLDTIVKDLKTTYANKPIAVYGHTDKDPIKATKDQWTDNLDLSANRAMAVTRYLISKGIAKESVETVAMSEWHPESTTDKAKNRRVEIYVIKIK